MDSKGRLTPEEEEVVREVGRMYDDACEASALILQSIASGNSPVLLTTGDVNPGFLSEQRKMRIRREKDGMPHDISVLRLSLQSTRGIRTRVIDDINIGPSGGRMHLSYEAAVAQDRQYNGYAE